MGNASASRLNVVFEAQWLAYALPCRRFTPALADDGARLGADVDRYSFIAVDLHHLLLAGLPAHTQPTYRAFTVVKREGQDDFWLAIGAAFMHQDGDGYNVVLQALPIDGRIVLRLPKDEKSDQQPQERADSANKSGSRRR
jgi:hypothetical protein